MRSICLLATILCATLQIDAQNIDKIQLQKLYKIDLGFQGLGFSYETRLGRNKTIEFAAGSGGSYGFGGIGGGFTYDLYLDDPAIYISVTPKLYYNREKRYNRGKNTRLNSGNYFGLRLKYASAPLRSNFYYVDDALLLNVHWGIQRAIGSHFLFNTHAGVGLEMNLDDITPSPYLVLDAKFSYVFGRK